MDKSLVLYAWGRVEAYVYNSLSGYITLFLGLI